MPVLPARCPDRRHEMAGQLGYGQAYTRRRYSGNTPTEYRESYEGHRTCAAEKNP